MKRIAIFLSLNLPIYFFSAFASGAVHEVKMKSISYDPKILTLNVGDAVSWQNVSYTNHSATANNGTSFDTKMVAPEKKSTPLVFDHVGNFDYHCSLHGKSMSGQIIVVDKK